MLHTGEAEPKLVGNTGAFRSLIWSTLFLTFIDTIFMGVFAYAINFLLGNAKIEDISIFLIVPPATCLLAMILTLPVVSLVGIVSFNKGLDPDIILYPAMSTIDDIIVTLSYVLVVSLTFISGSILIMSIILIMIGVFFFSTIIAKYRREEVFKRTVIEGGPMVLFSSILGTFGGVGLASLRGEIEARPSVLIIYPALIDTLGDIGSILGSLQTTKLKLGYVAGYWSSLKSMLLDLASVEIAAGFMHVLFGVVAFLFVSAMGLSVDMIVLIRIALISNLVSFFFISIISHLVAIQTFRYGLDPDNFVIPFVTSISDIGATLSLIATITIIGA